MGGDLGQRWPRCAPSAPDGVRGDRRRSACRARCTVPCVLDAADRPLRPAILWNDGRAQAECRLLIERVPDLGRIAGVPAMPGFTAPKLLWLAAARARRCSPASRRCCCPRTMSALRLTGEHVTDPCDAAGTLWLDEADAGLVARDPGGHRPDRGADAAHRRGREPAAARCAPRHRRRARPAAGHPGRRRAPATRPPARSASVPSTTATPSSRWAPRRQYFVTTASYRPYPERLIHAYCHGLPGALVPDALRCSTAPAASAGRRALLGEPDIPALLGPGRGALARPVARPVPALPRRRAHAARRPARARRPVRARRRHRRRSTWRRR